MKTDFNFCDYHILHIYGINQALGRFALEKAGYPLAYIQALAGHADTKMTTLYREGHETVQPQSVAVGNLDDVDWSNINWSTPLAPELLNILD